MATIATLRKYKGALDDAMSEESASGSAASSLESLPSKGHLSELASLERKVRLSHTASASASSASASASNSSNSGKRKDKEVALQERVLRLIDRRTNQTSMNMLLATKYYTSPLRLYLKVMVQASAPAQQEALLRDLKAPDRIKVDLMSPWGAADVFGLKMLIKMRRMCREVLPLFKSNTDFMRYMKPGAAGNTKEQNQVAYYLLNELLHPGKELENNVHQWFDGFIADKHDLIEEAGFTPDDARLDLVKTLAFALNTYATGITSMKLKFKYQDGAGAVHANTIDVEEALRFIHEKFTAFPAMHEMAHAMNMWASMDEQKKSNGRVIM